MPRELSGQQFSEGHLGGQTPRNVSQLGWLRINVLASYFLAVLCAFGTNALKFVCYLSLYIAGFTSAKVDLSVVCPTPSSLSFPTREVQSSKEAGLAGSAGVRATVVGASHNCVYGGAECTTSD
jgi:hypothetical protein